MSLLGHIFRSLRASLAALLPGSPWVGIQMAVDFARDAYHHQRQEQLVKGPVEGLPNDTFSSQSQSLGRRYKHASAMEAQLSLGLEEERATYGSPNAAQVDRYGGQHMQFPPRSSSNQRSTGNASPATPASERFRTPHTTNQSPNTPIARNVGSQEMASNQSARSPTSHVGIGRASSNQTSLTTTHDPTTPQRISTTTSTKVEGNQNQGTSYYQTPLESSVPIGGRERGRNARSQELPNQTSGPVIMQAPRAPRVEVDEGSRSYHSPTQRSSPLTQGSSTPQGQSSRPQNSVSEHTDRNTDQHRPAQNVPDSGAVLNRVVISDPEIDIKREEERIEEINPGASLEEAVPKGTKRRQDFSANTSKRKDGAKFGEYILGQTLGEGEFGKVKLGWKKDGSVEVAIKLIRRENLNANPTRLPKIYREVNILRGLQHPNIVRLHEMLETDRYIGIVMECASGGELFDYILHHRYLKDGPAKRLFAQLVSGVGYLHKVGIVHRDLKLENLLLDRHRNIIITDFGFANTFDPADELGETIEERITDKTWVKKYDLDRINRHTGFRRGDLMATSCGSPCYAAPELVVTDSLYTGRKVDVWSCGVILYAMLAGYLPFDDDPANPEGDNINLLYKYIVSTPLTFPEYVSPHSRDLLRRMLVPDPRKRADLFEVARHSWLSEYASAIAQFTSMSTDPRSLPVVPVTPEKNAPPPLARSASVREPTKPHTNTPSTVGGLTHRGGLDAQAENQKAPRDHNRRTIQVEYVAPQSQTTRGEDPVPQESQSYTRGHAARAPADSARQAPARKPLPQDPSPSRYSHQNKAVPTSPHESQYSADMAPPPSRPTRDPPRSVSDSASAFGQYAANTTTARPNTRGSMSSASGGRLPSRGNSYSQPLAPTVAATNAQGRLAQPKGPRYNISAPIPQPEPYIPNEPGDRPSSQRIPVRQTPAPIDTSQARGHKRSSTLSNIFGKSGSLFGGSKPQAQTPTEPEKSSKKYPPTSMKGPMASGATPRVSSESRRTEPRRTSFGFSRKSSDVSRPDRSRRFSLIPQSFSLKNFSSSPKDATNMGTSAESDSLQFEQSSTPTYNATPQIPYNASEPMLSQPRTRVLQKSQRNFSEAYNQDDSTKHAGTSGPARRVMDFFRRRSKARSGED